MFIQLSFIIQNMTLTLSYIIKSQIIVVNLQLFEDQNHESLLI